jgi:hypothetical protein
MELVISFELDGDGLLGRPREHNPRLAVWTTDPSQRRTVARGKAVDWHVLEKQRGDGKFYVSKRPTVISPTVLGDDNGKLIFPINDPMEELCVALYVDSDQGSRHHPGPMAVVGLGHVFVPWHVILRFMVSDGHATLDHDPSGTTSSAANLFPRTQIKQEFSSLITRDGIDYRVASLAGTHKTKELSVQLSKMDAAAVAHKATLGIKVGLMMPTSALLQSIDFPERLKVMERFLIEKCPPHRMRHKPEGIDHFVFALQQYDAMTNERDRLVAEAMVKYQQVYESLWSEDKKRALLLHPHGVAPTGPVRSRARLSIPPNVPSMARFHLPTWAPSGNERIPFVLWWKASLPRFAEGHFPAATAMTEEWLAHLLALGLRRANVDKALLVTTLANVTRDASNVDLDHLRRYSLVGTHEYVALVRVRESVDYMISSMSHAAHYSHDQRFANARFYYHEKRRRLRNMLFKYDVESPQHDIAAGVNQDGDCEDLETLIMMLDDLIKNGRPQHMDEVGRSWSNEELKLLRSYLSMMAHYSNFGSVDGAQVKDAQGKEELEGFVHSPQDLGMDIGGHMYSLTESLVRIEYRYTKHRKLVKLLYGEDLGAIVHEYTQKLLLHWTKGDTLRADMLREVYLHHPGAVHEGTGRQECLLLPNEHYLGMSDELLQKAAQHVAEIDVIKHWPSEKASGEGEGEEEEEEESDEEQEDAPLSKSLSTPDAPLFVGEALNYGFQRRLMADSRWSVDVHSGKRFERHLTPFYRRLGSSFCPDLNLIAPRVFNHLIWISVPSKEDGAEEGEEEGDDDNVLMRGVTVGPTLRQFLELDGGALPLPLPKHLAETYEGNAELVAAFQQRMRRIIPCDFSFRHLSSSSKQDLGRDAAILAAGEVGESYAPRSSMATGAAGQQHQESFFARSEYRSKPGVEPSFSMVGSERHVLGKQQDSSSSSSSVMITYTDSKGAVARIMRARNLGKSWECCVRGRFNVVATSAPDQVERIAKLLHALPGVETVEIVRERVLPSLPDLLCIYFDRQHRFVVDDERAEALRREAEEKARAKQKKMVMMMARQEATSSQRSASAFSAAIAPSSSSLELPPLPLYSAKERKEKLLVGFTLEMVRKVARKLAVDTSVIALDRLQRGMNVELEHGSRYADLGLNVTQDDPLTTAKIALAHLVENPGKRDEETGEWIIPDYYMMLDAMEERADKQWQKEHKKPAIIRRGRLMPSYGTFDEPAELEEEEGYSTSSTDMEEGEEKGEEEDLRLLPSSTHAELWGALRSAPRMAAELGRDLHTIPMPSGGWMPTTLSNGDLHY